MGDLQGLAKRWTLGCGNSPPVARGSQEAGFTQLIDHSLAQPCTGMSRWTLGCVNLLPATGGSQEVGFTEPRAHHRYVKKVEG